MANAGTVFIVLGADNKPFKATAAETIAIAQRTGEQAGAAWEQAGKKAKGLEASLAGIAKEERAQDKLTGWYAGQIMNVGSAFMKSGESAKIAKEGISQAGGVIMDLATGGYIGAVIGALGLAAWAWKELGEASEESSKEAKKQTAELNDLLKKQREELEKIRFLQGGGTERTYEVERQRKANQGRLDQLNKEVGLAENMMSGGTDWVGKSSKLTNIANTGESAAPLREYLGKLYEERSRIIQDLKKAEEQAIAADNADAAKKLADEDRQHQDEERKRKEEHHKKLLEEERKYQAAFLKAQQEFSLSAFQATKGVDYSRSQGGVLNLQDHSAAGQGFDANTTPTVYNLMNQQGGQGNTYDPERLKQVNEQLKAQQKELEKTGQRWQGYGETINSTLADITSGHKKWGDLFKEILKEVAKVFYEYAVKSIMAQAGVAAANTEAQMSSTGPWGWAVGLGAMGVVFSAVMGLIDSIGSAEGGWRLPDSGGPFPAVLHQGERVLNEKQNRDYERLGQMVESGRLGGAAGGSGAPSATFVLPNVYDSKGLDRHMRQNERVYIENFKRWGREGKI